MEEFVESDFISLKVCLEEVEWEALNASEKKKFTRIKGNYENLVDISKLKLLKTIISFSRLEYFG